MKKLFLILLLLSGCGEWTQQDNSFTPNYDTAPIHVQKGLLGTEAAVHFWNGNAGQEVFVLADDGIPIELDPSLLPDHNGHSSFNHNECVVKVAYDSWNIIAHELGHCLGFGHSTDDKSIMFWWTPSDGILNEDYKQDLINWLEGK